MTKNKPQPPVSERPVIFCGDPHGKFDQIFAAVERTNPCAVILLGDMEAQRPLEVELASIVDRLWFIPGNHDADADLTWANLGSPELAERCLHGRVATLPNGMRVAGLGGVFRKSVWMPSEPGDPNFRTRAEHARATPRQDRWNGGPHRRHGGTIYPEEYARLAALRADLLVTHEASAITRTDSPSSTTWREHFEFKPRCTAINTMRWIRRRNGQLRAFARTGSACAVSRPCGRMAVGRSSCRAGSPTEPRRGVTRHSGGPMRIWLDTEFTGLDEPDLLSVGIEAARAEGLGRHHALVDARAMRAGYLAAEASPGVGGPPADSSAPQSGSGHPRGTGQAND